MGVILRNTRSRTPVRKIGVALSAALLTLALTGCGGSSGSDQQQKAEETTTDTHVEYTVRGRVTQLPGGPKHPAREFIVRHEAIPEFRPSMAPDDDRIGMMSMAMAFPLGEGVSLDGIHVGDPVEMMFEATYDGESGRLKGYEVRWLTPLDAGTSLDLAGSKPQLP